jgi:hypothetical protein
MARKTEHAPPTAPPAVEEEQVVAWLKGHPDLLARRPELVARLVPPSRFGAEPVVDLQQVMIRRLTDELEQMKGCAEHLITTSRSNMSIQTRTHEAVLAVLAAGSMEGLARVVAEDLPTLLDIDVAIIGFEAAVAPDCCLGLPIGLLERILGSADVLLRDAAPGQAAIFGAAAPLVSSFALARLTPPERPEGMLALGSRQERTFHAAQGTELLAFLAHVVADCVARWWPADLS